jgi:hypothetical protein
VVGPAGEALFTVRPPEEPGEVRWRLLIQNMLAHGSMLLRRGSVLEAGGYDEEWTKAQDYELWLRLTRRWGLGAVQRVLYRHVVRDASDPMRGRGEQSRLAVRAMVREWALLPEGGAECERALAQAGSLEASRSEIERALAAGASRAGLMAWLWAGHASLATPARAVGVARRALVREVGAGLKADGVKGVWLWGAGDHTRKVLEHAEDFGVPVLGIVDDRVRGERFGLRVVGPESLSGSEVVVLSSDWHEAELWEASKASRDRGVRVVRLYA